LVRSASSRRLVSTARLLEGSLAERLDAIPSFSSSAPRRRGWEVVAAGLEPARHCLESTAAAGTSFLAKHVTPGADSAEARIDLKALPASASASTFQICSRSASTLSLPSLPSWNAYRTRPRRRLVHNSSTLPGRSRRGDSKRIGVGKVMHESMPRLPGNKLPQAKGSAVFRHRERSFIGRECESSRCRFGSRGCASPAGPHVNHADPGLICSPVR